MNNIWFPVAVVVVIAAACAVFWPFGLIDVPPAQEHVQYEKAEVEANLKRDAAVFEELRKHMAKAKGHVLVSQHWVQLGDLNHQPDQVTDAHLGEHGLTMADLEALTKGRAQLGLANIRRDPDGVEFTYLQPNRWRIKWTDHVDTWSVMPDPSFKGD